VTVRLYDDGRRGEQFDVSLRVVRSLSHPERTMKSNQVNLTQEYGLIDTLSVYAKHMQMNLLVCMCIGDMYTFSLREAQHAFSHVHL
jgi:hypothetical protein